MSFIKTNNKVTCQHRFLCNLNNIPHLQKIYNVSFRWQNKSNILSSLWSFFWREDIKYIALLLASSR